MILCTLAPNLKEVAEGFDEVSMKDPGAYMKNQ